MVAKHIDYLPIVQAMEQLVAYLRDLKVTMENPDGYDQEYSISDVRILYLENGGEYVRFLNGLQTPIRHTVPTPQLLVTLFYENPKKVVNFPLPIESDALRDPQGMLMLMTPYLKFGIDRLFKEFYLSDPQDNLLYVHDTSDEVVSLPDENFKIEALQPLEVSVMTYLQGLVKQQYLHPQAYSASASYFHNRKLWIVVDFAGRRVIQKQDSFEVMMDSELTNSEKHIYVESLSRMYPSLEQLTSNLEALKTASQVWIQTLKRKQLKSDVYPLIFAPSAVGTLFHEALAGHMLSGLYIAEEYSTVFKGKLGEKVTKPGVMEILDDLEIWDCPLDEKMFAHYQYDMEGVRAQDTCLIANGKLLNYLLDRNSAAWLKLPNNGHALAGVLLDQVSYGILPEAIEPEPRVSNLKIKNSSSVTLDEIKAKYFKDFGYYLWVESYSGEVDVTTGTFNLFVDRLIKVYPDGREEYFYGGKFSAGLTDFISAIWAASDHYGSSQGYCGASSGNVPTEEYVPAMAIYGVNWVPNPMPEVVKILDTERDKYIPLEWRDVQNQQD